MTIQRGLLRIYWRQALPATLFGLFGLTAYALFWPEVMTGHDVWPALLVFVQSLALAGLLGRTASPAFAFLDSRGYSRDVLWGHMMLASMLSVLTAWLPAALTIWIGLRSAVQDHWFQSPFFPVMARCENWTPAVWAGLSLLLVPAFHYAWIRQAQPTQGGSGGRATAFVAVMAVVTVFLMGRYLSGWLGWFLVASYVVAWISFILGGRALYRSLEVRT